MNAKEKACIAIILALSIEPKVRRRRLVKGRLQKRNKYSHVSLLKEIRTSEAEDFRNCFWIDGKTFRNLLGMVAPYIQKQDTNIRESISVNKKLVLTLRYLATGRSFEDLKFSAVLSPATINQIILETCEVLIYVLQAYIKFPTTPDMWIKISDDFGKFHQFYNTLGSIDVKHIAIKKPANSGSLYHNHKGFYSIVLLAVVNARQEFIMVDVGINGRMSDEGVLYYSKFGELIQNRNLNLPKPFALPNTEDVYPYAFVADEAFALNNNLIKPYSQKALNPERNEFNKRLSRAQVVVENAVGILASRFGVFQKPINLEPENAETITMACCYLHNFLAKENSNLYMALNEENTNNLIQIQSTQSRNSAPAAKENRDKLCHYYNNEGKLGS